LLDATRTSRNGSRGGRPEGVVAAGGSVWVVNQADRSVWQVNPRSVRRVRSFSVGNGAEALALGFGSLWVANTLDARSPGSAPPATRADDPAEGLAGRLSRGPDGIWVTSRSTDSCC